MNKNVSKRRKETGKESGGGKKKKLFRGHKKKERRRKKDSGQGIYMYYLECSLPAKIPHKKDRILSPTCDSYITRAILE